MGNEYQKTLLEGYAIFASCKVPLKGYSVFISSKVLVSKNFA